MLPWDTCVAEQRDTLAGQKQGQFRAPQSMHRAPLGHMCPALTHLTNPVLPLLPSLGNNEIHLEKTTPKPSPPSHECLHLFFCQVSEKRLDTNNFVGGQGGLEGCRRQVASPGRGCWAAGDECRIAKRGHARQLNGSFSL